MDKFYRMLTVVLFIIGAVLMLDSGPAITGAATGASKVVPIVSTSLGAFFILLSSFIFTATHEKRKKK